MSISYLRCGRLTPTKLIAMVVLISISLGPHLPTISAQSEVVSEEGESETSAQERAEKERQQRVKLAVALNYCRASFHRINKYQSQQVLKEEQQRILNNLDLSSIDDAAVIKLYTDVIQEINQIQLVENEQEIIKGRHNRDFRERFFFNAFAVGANVATFNYVGAVQSGARSFWDYRSASWNTENDSWKLEKSHLNSLTAKTTSFIETSWKLARERKIPDEWMIRDRDIEEMYTVLQEPDLETRLRVLKRKESFLQCFPPYYYYIGRLQQSLGHLQDSAETYRKLRDLEQGHMRRDDMLAASLANLAAIEHHFGDPRAVQTAQLALEQSTEVWEANLLCANILADAGKFTVAEDAVLRNLDVALETEDSRNALVMVYARSGDSTKLAKHLADREFVASLKAPVLLKCALAMGGQGLPAPASQKLLASLHARVNVTHGRDDLVITASDDWALGGAHLKISYADIDLGRPQVSHQNGQLQMVYRGILEIGTPWKQTLKVRPLAMEVQFPDQPAVAFELTPGGTTTAQKTLQLAGQPKHPGSQPNGYLLTNVRSDEYVIAFDGSPSKILDQQLATPEQSPEDQTEVTQQSPEADPSRKIETYNASQPRVRINGIQEANPESVSELPVQIDAPLEFVTPE